MNHLKKVLLVAPYGGVPGGISRWTGHIMEYYDSKGQKDCKLGLVPMGRSMFVNINMNTWQRLRTAWIDYRKIFKDFFSKVNSGEYEVMHLTSSGSLSLYKDFVMLKKARRHGLKTVVHFRFGRIPELAVANNREWSMLRRVCAAADSVIVIDRASYDALHVAGFQNIELLANPVAPAVEKIVEENKDTARVKGEILFCGHVVETKGVFELLEACRSVSNIHLNLVGHITPKMRGKITDAFGSPEWLTVYGEMPYAEVIKKMLECDIFVLPTYTEGFPNVILESMAAGCAIVTTPVGAIPQILEPDADGNEYGVLVEPRNVAQLREAIAGLLVDDERKDAMRTRVQKRVIERYNISAVWQQMVSIWNSI